MGRTRFNLPAPRSHDRAGRLAAGGLLGLLPPTGPDAAALAALLATLPPGQRRVAEAFVAEARGRTRGETAAALGVHVGTVHRHLGRIKDRRPEVYAALIVVRQEQLARRHRDALNRIETRRFVRRYTCQHVYGCEPWERRTGLGYYYRSRKTLEEG